MSSPLLQDNSRIIEPPTLSEKESYEIITVSKQFLSRTAHRIFMKLHMKLWCLKGKKLTAKNTLGQSDRRIF